MPCSKSGKVTSRHGAVVGASAIAYIRASSDEQRLSPEAQRTTLEALCAARGWALRAVHVDHGVSGGAPLDKRPGLLAALDSVGKGDVLVVAKRDRLARDMLVSLLVERELKNRGGAIVSADGAAEGDGPEAQLMRRILDAFAEYERAMIKLRTKQALAAKKRQGKRVGQVPYGFRVGRGGMLEPDAAEQQTLREIREWHESGLSATRICAQLEADGAPARGSRWHATTIRRLLASC